MRRPALALLALGLWGCGTTTSPGGKVAAADTTSDTSTSTGVCKSLPAVAGTVHAWPGKFSAGGKSYTKDACPNGRKELQGSWRQVDSQTEDPATPFSDGTKEVITFDGNTFTDHLAGPDNGKLTEQTSSGWYWCGDPSELSSGHNVVVLEKASPEGAFGNSSGDIFSAEWLTQGPNQMAYGLFSGFEGKSNGSYFYCRIGSTVNGHCCNDPFAK
jgi:hypothetical protein